MKSNSRKRGFTLIELLIVVLIVAILAAVAVPQYQKAVLKSRFSSLMPIAKSIASSNEVYYMEHGNYASSPANLDVAGQATYADGTALALGNNLDYAYVLASRPDANNRYIVYQHHSVNFPNEAHCEALDNNTQAVAVCQSLGFTKDKGHILSDAYTTYTQEGDGNGMAPGVRLLASLASCAPANSKTGYTCTNSVDTQNGTATKEVCTTAASSSTDVCFKTIYYADGSYIQYGSVAPNYSGVSTQYAKYDADGNLLSSWSGYYNSLGSIRGGGADYVYDANGVRRAEKWCSERDSSTFECTSYSNTIFSYIYDDDGKLSYWGNCWGTLNSDGTCSQNVSARQTYFYDSEGKLTGSQDENGTYSYIYDNEGRLIARKNINDNGYGNYVYVYNEDGTGRAKRTCGKGSITETGGCSFYMDNQNDTAEFGWWRN